MTKRQAIIQDALSYLQENHQMTGHLIINDGKSLNTWYVPGTDINKVSRDLYQKFGYRSENYQNTFIKTISTNRTNQIALLSGCK